MAENGQNRHSGHQPVRAGSMTMLITVVLVLLSVLSVLTFSTAHADLALAERQLDRLSVRMEAENLGQEWLAQVDAGLVPENTVVNDDGTLSAALPVADGERLCILAQQDGTLLRWELEQDWTPDQSVNLWPGA